MALQCSVLGSGAAVRIALFDMDRTLVRVDTATLYVRYQRALGEIGVGEHARMAWWLLRYTFGVIDAPKVARQALKSYRGRSEAWMIERCQGWFGEWVVPHVAEAGRRAVERHQRAGDVIAIVTGATTYAASPLAAMLGIEHVVCTELELDERGNFTGELLPPMCYGAGKIERAGRLAERLGVSLADATFYTDSITDLPLLDAVKDRVIVNPDARLARVARRRGWPIERW